MADSVNANVSSTRGQSFLIWKLCTTLLQAIAVLTTFLRLGYRLRSGRQWWDDLIIIFPLIFDFIFVILLWLTLNVSMRPTNVFFSPWFNSYIYIIVIWMSRISLTLSIANIIPQGSRCKTFAFSLTAIFTCLWIAKMFMGVFQCYFPGEQWYNIPFNLCVIRRPATKRMTRSSPAFDLSADILLIVLPLCVLWKVQLHHKERRLLRNVLFCITILTIIASIAFIATWFLDPKDGALTYIILRLTAQIQAAISILVCNLLEIARILYHVMHQQRSYERRRRRDSPSGETLDLRAIASERERDRERKGRDSKKLQGRRDREPATTTTQSSTIILTTIHDDYFSVDTSLEQTNGYVHVVEDDERRLLSARMTLQTHSAPQPHSPTVACSTGNPCSGAVMIPDTHVPETLIMTDARHSSGDSTCVGE